MINGLAGAGLNHAREGSFARLVIEKPYGNNLSTARELDQVVHAAFDEPHVFRIDHYLGKDTVQNVLALRFANSIFQPIWDRSWVDHVQITVAETLGVGTRALNINRKGLLFWPTRSKVVVYEPHRELAFRIKDNATIWAYVLEPTATGTS